MTHRRAVGATNEAWREAPDAAEPRSSNGKDPVATIARISRVAALAIARALFALLAVPMLVLPWFAGRLLRISPLDQPTGQGSGWISRARNDPTPAKPWQPDTSARALPAHRTVRRAISMVAVTAVSALAIFGTVAGVAFRLDPKNAIPAAFADAAWYPEYSEDIDWIDTNSVAFQPLSSLRFKDIHTRHVNIVDGARVTWKPPPCTCRRITVWMYGGSTTFGLGQRDGHTIPSELARLARAAGYTLDIVNRGVVGDTQWEEGQRFAWDVAVHPHPDLVIFYDGANDLWASNLLRTTSRQPLSPVTDSLWTKYVAGLPSPDPRRTDSALVTAPPLPEMSPADKGAHAVQRYETGRKIGKDIASVHRIPTAYFWQPLIENRSPTPGEPRDAGIEWSRRFSKGAVAALAPDVTDLTRVFDDVNEPVFYDSIHTNELGARVVAEAMLVSITPELDRLVSSRRTD